MSERELWVDTEGQPVVTTTRNGHKNAVRWGWTPATAYPYTTRLQGLSDAWQEGYNTGKRDVMAGIRGQISITTDNPYQELLLEERRAQRESK